ncbi:NrsF family protein [Rhizobium sp. S152]|uniref:NrsF family protein n=1 Tax=Rhizobium sp. S152 TaxID=3055038 RepID=UPI0025A99748|nr:NrsF family protein [Rhizobium sp. S152]MDM9627803.1 NrsF family protein [Rhizobium sp. S152]
METADLIRSLADNVKPVKRLRPPLIRSIAWVLMALGLLMVLTALHGPRPQFGERLRDGMFLAGMLSSLGTGVLAAIATFLISLPDRSRLWMLLPAPTLVVWMSTIGYQCFAGWVDLPPGAVTVEAASSCLLTLVVTSVPLSLMMIAMLRYAALLRPVSVTLLGSLAVSGVTCSALAMFHPLDATIMVLGWNLGTAVLLASLASLLSRGMSGFRGRID